MTDIESQFADALKAYEQGNYQQALTGFQAIATVKPHASEVQLNIGNVHFQTGNMEAAEAAFRQAIELDPLEANAYLNLGSLFFRQNKLEQAVAHWEIFKKLQKGHTNVWLNLGIAYDKLGDPARALDNYAVFLGLSPNSSDAQRLKLRYERARAMFENNVKVAEGLLAKGDRAQAKTILTGALAAYPGNAKIYKTYASLLYQDGELHDALIWYQRAYELKPDDPATLINLGVIHEKLNQPISALWAYHLAKNLPSPEQAKVAQRFEALLSKQREALSNGLPEAQSLLRQGRYREAEALLNQLLALGEYVGEQKALKDLLEKVQDAQDPHLRAARSYLNKASDADANGRLDQALDYYQKFLALKPTGEQADEINRRIEHIKGVVAAVAKTMLGQP